MVTLKQQVAQSLRRLSFSECGRQRVPSTGNDEVHRTSLILQNDVIWMISQHITSLGVILDLCLTSHNMCSLLLPRLYSNVVLDSNFQCRTTLSLFLRQPSISQYVRCLVIRTNHRSWDTLAREDEQEETWAVELLTKIMSIGGLHSLQTFKWDGMEIPSDHLWLALRTHCPSLRNIGCSVGHQSLEPTSQLFRFSDLTGFSLTSHTCNFRSHRAFHQTAQDDVSLPDALWSMLFNHCPDLHELVINGHHTHLWNIENVTKGRWPRLWKLSLGHHPGGLNNLTPFRHFLSAHPNLKDVTLTGLRSVPWDSFSDSSLVDLPPIDAFTGFWPIHRSTVPYPSYQSLRSVKAYHILWIPSSWMMTTVFPTLHCKLPHLRSLSISVEFKTRVGTSNLDFFRSLFSSCLNLTHLEILSSSHFDMHDLAIAIEDALHLTSFHLVKVSRITDEDLTKSAVRLVGKRPGLKCFTIVHVCPWKRSEEYLVRQKGIYEVIHGKKGIPTVLVVNEVGHRRGQICARRYRLNLPVYDSELK